MKNRKILSAAILLVLTQFAWGIGNPEYTGTPYGNISAKKPKIFKENTSRTGQIGKQEVDFFEISNNAPDSGTPFPIADVELEFSCPQAETNNAFFGWNISIWKHYANTDKADEFLKAYQRVSLNKCSDKFSMLIEQNDDSENEVASYYVGVQSACVEFPNTTIFKKYYPLADSDVTKDQSCDTSDYKLKLGAIPKVILQDINTLTADELKSSIPLGSVKTGQIQLDIDKNIYSVETYSTTDTAGTNEVPLLFSCTAAAARQTNDWKLTVYNDKNTLVTGYPRFINGSDCGSTLVDDKGGFKFTLPKDSPRYFVSVQSACDSQSKKTCYVETSQYNIARDVTKIYTGSLSATKNITATNASFKLTRCGLNANSTIAVKVENADLRDIFKATKSADKKPIKLQIGTMACQILTKQSFAPAELMLGGITGNAEMIDAQLIAKDSATVTLSECVSSNAPDFPSKITLTGTKLDLENLNPSPITTDVATPTTATPATNSVVIPVKVDIGDFHCEGKDAFYIDDDKPKVGDTTYSLINEEPVVAEPVPPTPTAFVPYANVLTTQVLNDTFKTRIKTSDEIHFYSVASSLQDDVPVEFSCSKSTNTTGWTVSLWEHDLTNDKKAGWLYRQYVLTPKDCANAVKTLTIPSSSHLYYVSVQSSCLNAPKTNDSELNASQDCAVNTDNYTIKQRDKIVAPIVVVKAPDSFDDNWLLSKKNLGASQIGQIKAQTDSQIYQVDTAMADVNLTFTCDKSIRYQNDWKVFIYDDTKTLKSTKLINGSSCGTGQEFDTGAYLLPSLPKDSPTYYVVVKSACETNDKTCVVDTSQYQLKRVSSAQIATQTTTTTGIKKPCFGNSCDAVINKPNF